MSMKARRPAKKSARRPRYTDEDMAADAERMLDEITERGGWSSASTVAMADNLRKAREQGLGPRGTGRPLLYATAEGIVTMHHLFLAVADMASAPQAK